VYLLVVAGRPVRDDIGNHAQHTNAEAVEASAVTWLAALPGKLLLVEAHDESACAGNVAVTGVVVGYTSRLRYEGARSKIEEAERIGP
jgi:hypothetical protein